MRQPTANWEKGVLYSKHAVPQKVRDETIEKYDET
jgi:hypothetical protein